MALSAAQERLMDQGMFALFMETYHVGGTREQWVIFPQATSELGGLQQLEGYCGWMTRRIRPDRPKAKWEYRRGVKPESLADDFDKAAFGFTGENKWAWREPVLVIVEPDDYRRIWGEDSPKTPQKLLRHIERETKKAGYRLTSEPKQS